MSYRAGYRVKFKQKKDQFKDYSKEERAKACNNVICPRCKYQNHYKWIRLYGKCNLCGLVLSKDRFKKDMRRLLNG